MYIVNRFNILFCHVRRVKLCNMFLPRVPFHHIAKVKHMKKKKKNWKITTTKIRITQKLQTVEMERLAAAAIFLHYTRPFVVVFVCWNICSYPKCMTSANGTAMLGYSRPLNSPSPIRTTNTHLRYWIHYNDREYAETCAGCARVRIAFHFFHSLVGGYSICVWDRMGSLWTVLLSIFDVVAGVLHTRRASASMIVALIDREIVILPLRYWNWANPRQALLCF